MSTTWHVDAFLLGAHWRTRQTFYLITSLFHSCSLHHLHVLHFIAGWDSISLVVILRFKTKSSHHRESMNFGGTKALKTHGHGSHLSKHALKIELPGHVRKVPLHTQSCTQRQLIYPTRSKLQGCTHLHKETPLNSLIWYKKKAFPLKNFSSLLLVMLASDNVEHVKRSKRINFTNSEVELLLHGVK